ncbi:MAG: shikimate kinase, partial [Erysipelotrichaceae bacterium]|nr:shikimate kinase [Erysipelotrichaceae bacterium]
MIAELGVEGFLKTEEDVCADVRAVRSVIATGGSVVYGSEAMRNLKETGIVV